MAKFRNKKLVVEAVQWFPNKGIYHDGIYCDREGPDKGKPYVITIHNERANLAPGDWIITEINGKNYYPCKPDIFEDTYEPA